MRSDREQQYVLLVIDDKDVVGVAGPFSGREVAHVWADQMLPPGCEFTVLPLHRPADFGPMMRGVAEPPAGG